jgi:hypothetical protein
MPTLINMYTHLLDRARASGQDRHVDLHGGARVAVRVKDGLITVSIARTPQRLGDVEIITFHKHFQIPAHAVRFPEEGQAKRTVDKTDWWMIGWTWADPAQPEEQPDADLSP